MAIITTPLPYVFSNGTTADATQVNADLNQITNNVNSNAAPINAPTFTGGATVGGGLVVSSSGILATGNSQILGTLQVLSTANVTLGGATGIVITNSGASLAGTFANSAQPAFQATLSGAVSSLTAGNPLLFNVVSQQGGTNYATGTGKFTAPNTGWYLLTWTVQTSNSSGGNVATTWVLNVNGSVISGDDFVILASGGAHYFKGSQIVSMTAGQTAFLSCNNNLTATLTALANGSIFAGAQLF